MTRKDKNNLGIQSWNDFQRANKGQYTQQEMSSKFAEYKRSFQIPCDSNISRVTKETGNQVDSNKQRAQTRPEPASKQEGQAKGEKKVLSWNKFQAKYKGRWSMETLSSAYAHQKKYGVLPLHLQHQEHTATTECIEIKTNKPIKVLHEDKKLTSTSNTDSGGQEIASTSNPLILDPLPPHPTGGEEDESQTTLESQKASENILGEVIPDTILRHPLELTNFSEATCQPSKPVSWNKFQAIIKGHNLNKQEISNAWRQHKLTGLLPNAPTINMPDHVLRRLIQKQRDQYVVSELLEPEVKKEVASGQLHSKIIAAGISEDKEEERALLWVGPDDRQTPLLQISPTSQYPDSDIVQLPSSRDTVQLPSSRDIVPLPSSRDIVPLPSSRDIVLLPSSRDIVPLPSSRDIVPLPSSASYISTAYVNARHMPMMEQQSAEAFIPKGTLNIKGVVKKIFSKMKGLLKSKSLTPESKSQSPSWAQGPFVTGEPSPVPSSPDHQIVSPEYVRHEKVLICAQDILLGIPNNQNIRISPMYSEDHITWTASQCQISPREYDAMGVASQAESCALEWTAQAQAAGQTTSRVIPPQPSKTMQTPPQLSQDSSPYLQQPKFGNPQQSIILQPFYSQPTTPNRLYVEPESSLNGSPVNKIKGYSDRQWDQINSYCESSGAKPCSSYISESHLLNESQLLHKNSVFREYSVPNDDVEIHHEDVEIVKVLNMKDTSTMKLSTLTDLGQGARASDQMDPRVKQLPTYAQLISVQQGFVPLRVKPRESIPHNHDRLFSGFGSWFPVDPRNLRPARTVVPYKPGLYEWGASAPGCSKITAFYLGKAGTLNAALRRGRSSGSETLRTRFNKYAVAGRMIGPIKEADKQALFKELQRRGFTLMYRFKVCYDQEPVDMETLLLQQVDYALNFQKNGCRRALILEGGRSLSSYPVMPQ